MTRMSEADRRDMEVAMEALDAKPNTAYGLAETLGWHKKRAMAAMRRLRDSKHIEAIDHVYVGSAKLAVCALRAKYRPAPILSHQASIELFAVMHCWAGGRPIPADWVPRADYSTCLHSIGA